MFRPFQWFTFHCSVGLREWASFSYLSSPSVLLSLLCWSKKETTNKTFISFLRSLVLCHFQLLFILVYIICKWIKKIYDYITKIKFQCYMWKGDEPFSLSASAPYRFLKFCNYFLYWFHGFLLNVAWFDRICSIPLIPSHLMGSNRIHFDGLDPDAFVSFH